eukprot:6474131-Prymnesium_polylepis.1
MRHGETPRKLNRPRTATRAPRGGCPPPPWAGLQQQRLGTTELQHAERPFLRCNSMMLEEAPIVSAQIAAVAAHAL